jgi:hypothetical protein
MALSRYGSKVLGLEDDLSDLDFLGLDPDLYRFKVGVSKEAVELLKKGMLQELTAGGSLYDTLSDVQKAELDQQYANLEAMDAIQLADLFRLSPDSQFRSLSVATSQAEALSGVVLNFQRSSFRAISSSAIDAFYFARQGTFIPKDLEEAGEFIQKSFYEDYVSSIREFENQLHNQPGVMDRARMSIASEMLNTKYMEQIRQATHAMRAMPGYENVDALDIADAIEVSEVMSRVGENRMSQLSTSIADEAGERFPDLKNLFDLAKLRRDYFSVATSSDYISGESETYRLHRIIDNAMTMMPRKKKARVRVSPFWNRGQQRIGFC